jgi:hypothetical protein
VADKYMKYTNELQQNLHIKDDYTISLEKEIQKLRTDAQIQIDNLNSSLEVAQTYSRSLEIELDKIRKSPFYKYFMKPWIR